jgi:hypothetical protein
MSARPAAKIPTLEIRGVQSTPLGGPGHADLTKPNDFGENNSSCPAGFIALGGGFRTIGPMLPTVTVPTDRYGWHVEAYNATTALSSGDELARVAAYVVCLRGAGITIIQRFD